MGMFTLSTLVGSLGRTHFKKRVMSIAWSHSDNMIASGDDKGNIAIHDASTGCIVATLSAHSGIVKRLVWGSGDVLGSCSADRVAMIWSAQNGWRPSEDKPLLLSNVQLRGHFREVTCQSFHPDGETVATSSLDTSVRFWSRGGTELRGRIRHESGVTCLSFSFSGLVLVSGTKHHLVRVFRFCTIKDEDGDTRCSAYCDSGDQIHGRDIFATVSVECMAFIREDTLVMGLGSRDTPLVLLHLRRSAAGQATRAQRGGDGLHFLECVEVDDAPGTHSNWVVDVVRSPGGTRVATAGDDCRTIVWEVDWGVRGQSRARPPRGGDAKLSLRPVGECEREHSHYITGASFSRDGLAIATSSVDGTVKLWRPPLGKSLQAQSAAEEEIGLLFSVACLHAAEEGRRGTPRVACLGGMPDLVGLILCMYATRVGEGAVERQRGAS